MNIIEQLPLIIRERCRFVKLGRRSKDPIEKGWTTTVNYAWNDPVLLRHIRDGGNYGILPRGGICQIDVDNRAVWEQKGVYEHIKDTLQVSSRPDGSRCHCYVICDDAPAEKIVYTDPLDKKIQYGDFRGSGSPFQLVGPGSIHPETGRPYTLVNGSRIKTFTWAELRQILSLMEEPPKAAPEPEAKANLKMGMPKAALRVDKSSITDSYDLRVEDFLTPNNHEIHDDEIQGAHPVHGSDNGMNLCINPSKGVWHCFRCDSGGDAATAAAVHYGLIDCSDAGTGCITTEIGRELVKRLEQDGYKNRNGGKMSQGKDALFRDAAPVVSNIDEVEAIGYNPHAYKLRCNLEPDNFITEYTDLWSKRMDAYPEYHHAGAITLLSIAADRKIVTRLNFGDFFTNSWCLCLGKSSVARKTTAIGKTKIIASAVYYETALPGSFSGEALFEKMSDHPRAWLIKDECAGILQAINKKTYMSDVRDFLSDIYECTSQRRSLRTGKRKERSEFVISDPYVTLLWATTPENFEESTTPIDVRSGLLPRFLYYAPSYQKDTMKISVVTDGMNSDYKDIGNRYASIRKALDRFSEIEMCPSELALAAYNAWYIEKQEELQNGSGVENTVFARISPYVFKLAALYYIGSEQFKTDVNDLKDTIKPYNAPHTDKEQTPLITTKLYIPDHHFLEALKNVKEYFLPVAVNVVTDIDVKCSNNVQKQIIQYLRECGGKATRSQVLRKLRLKSKDVDEHITTLEESESVRRVFVDNNGPRKTEWICLLKEGV